MVQVFKVVSVGELKPVQKRVNGELVELERLQNGERAVKRVVELRTLADYSIDQSGHTNFYYDTHYVELLGQRAEDNRLMEGSLVAGELRYKKSDYRMENCYLHKGLTVEVEDL